MANVTVTGYTAAHTQDIEDATIVGAAIVANELILTRHDSTTINLGNVKGATGSAGFTPDLRGLSVSTLAVTVATKTIVISPAMNVPFPVGSVVRISGASPSIYMLGTILASTTTSITVDVSEINGSGIYDSWTVTLGAFGGTSVTTVQGIVTGTRLVFGAGSGVYNIGTIMGSASPINAVLDISMNGAISIASSAMPTVAAGTQLVILFRQDATGGRVLTMTGIKRPGGALVLSTAPNAVDMVVFFFDGVNWYASLSGKSYS